MLEKEYKCLVTKEQWQSFLCLMKKKYGILCPEEAVQTNYYYDTADFVLNRTGRTLRIRQSGGRLLLQHKLRRVAAGGVVCSEETESPAAAIPREMDGAPYGVSRLELLGSLQTRRFRFVPLPGVQVDLDQNVYLGRTDYEIEIEFQGEAPAGLLALCPVRLPLPGQGLGKYSRFLAQYKKGHHYTSYPNAG